MGKYLFFILIFTSSLFAHKVNLFVTQEKNRVDIYAYFASGDACKGCKILIKQNDIILLEDTLNEEGKYQYEAKENIFTIIIDASSGHLVEKELTLNTLPKENLEEVIKKESSNQMLNIILSFVLMGVFFYGLKRIKKNAK
jgi:hypothetical protein